MHFLLVLLCVCVSYVAAIKFYYWSLRVWLHFCRIYCVESMLLFFEWFDARICRRYSSVSIPALRCIYAVSWSSWVLPTTAVHSTGEFACSTGEFACSMGEWSPWQTIQLQLMMLFYTVSAIRFRFRNFFQVGGFWCCVLQEQSKKSTRFSQDSGQYGGRVG